MILVILGIGLTILIAGLILTYQSIYEDWLYCTLNSVGGTICALSLIVIICLGVHVSEGKVIDQKITLYEEENIKIEQQVATVVESYMAHEQETFDKIAIDGDPTFVVTIFPELKSNELVNSQIQLYQANNSKIKELKAQKIDIELGKWWLYFG